MPDSDLAKQLGRAYEAVRDKRNQLRIAYKGLRYVWWKRHELELLEELAITKLRRCLAVPLLLFAKKIEIGDGVTQLLLTFA